MIPRLLILTALAAATFSAQTGVGAAYGTRNPTTCASTKDPAKGPISPAKAKEYVICGYDQERTNADELWLAEVQSIEVGKPRPFDIRSDVSDADPKELVYPIRGNQTTYSCHKIKNGYPMGTQCQQWNMPDAHGTCFRTSFGDWKCVMPLGTRTQSKGPGPR